MTDQVKEINHAQFADNMILLRGAFVVMEQRFKAMTSNAHFKESKNKLNEEKCFLYKWNIPIIETTWIARLLNFQVKFN